MPKGGRTAARENMTEIMMAQRGDVVERCAKACRECNQICLETMTYCLGKGGRHAEADRMKLMRDCEEMCNSSAQHMLRSSRFYSDLCNLCARICDECANDCAQFRDDAWMPECAASCRNCSEVFVKMISGE